jgi:hypothetical protein
MARGPDALHFLERFQNASRKVREILDESIARKLA